MASLIVFLEWSLFGSEIQCFQNPNPNPYNEKLELNFKPLKKSPSCYQLSLKRLFYIARNLVMFYVPYTLSQKKSTSRDIT